MTDWEKDREQYERDNPQWRTTETPEEAFKRLEAEDVKVWREMVLAESREDFYARILPRLGLTRVPVKRALMGYKTAAKFFSGETKKVAKRGETKEVIALRARVRELEALLRGEETVAESDGYKMIIRECK